MNMDKELMERYAKKTINPDYYGKLIVSGSFASELTQEEFESGKQGLVYLNDNSTTVFETFNVFSVKEHPNCLHDSCNKCHGTGRDNKGRMCVHMISCPCPKCSPSC